MRVPHLGTQPARATRARARALWDAGICSARGHGLFHDRSPTACIDHGRSRAAFHDRSPAACSARRCSCARGIRDDNELLIACHGRPRSTVGGRDGVSCAGTRARRGRPEPAGPHPFRRLRCAWLSLSLSLSLYIYIYIYILYLHACVWASAFVPPAAPR